MRIPTIIVILLLLVSSVIAQNENEKPKTHVKYNITSIPDRRAPYIQLSVEYPIAQRFSLEHEIGYLENKFDFFGLQIFRKYAGVRLRNQLHFFLPDISETKKHRLDLHLTGQYISVQPQDQSFSRFDGAFIQNFQITPRFHDTRILVGYSRLFYEPKAHIVFEIGAAMGFKRTFFSYGADGLPDDARLTEPINFSLISSTRSERDNVEGVLFLTTITVNFKVGLFF